MKIFIISLSLQIIFNFIEANNADSLINEFSIDMLESMSKANIVGMGLSIMSRDSVIFQKGYGYANQKTAKPFTTNTIMNIASISKTFIGVSIMHLVENGKVNLDDDINVYLPFEVSNPFSSDSIITLRHLMSHTSGIIDNNKIYSKYYNYGGDSPVPLEQFLKDYLSTNGKLYSKNNFAKIDPGAQFHYSNIGAGLAGLIVEKISGKSFNVFTKECIFKPLEMNSTCWFISEMDDIENHSKLYKSQFFHLIKREVDLYGLCTYPDGGLRTSINDLSKYLLFIANYGKNTDKIIIKENSIIEMLRIDYVNHYTKFWEIRNDNSIGHGGSDPGVSTGMYYSFKNNIGIIFFVNTNPHGKFENMIKRINEFAMELSSLEN